jgi:CheY-like chemotaxis protein
LQSPHVVHVEPAERDHDRLTTALHDAFEDVSIDHVRTGSAALERLETDSVTCIVSAYDLPNGDALAFLEAVRDRNATVPFVLFTDVEATTIARRALSSAVTDYVSKDDSDPYASVAERVETLATDDGRSQWRDDDRYRQFVETVHSPMALLDADGR